MHDLWFLNHFTQLIMTCLTTTQYSILINEVPIDLVHPKGGLRKSDPLSPLIFTPCKKYFSIAMQTVGEYPNFKFHFRCKSLKINHICFVDVLLMFSKRDKDMIQLMLEGFQVFTDTIGLVVNPQKSSIYYCGVTEHQLHEIIEISGFNLGSLPFKYLGVPLSPCKFRASNVMLLLIRWLEESWLVAPRIFLFLGGQLVNYVMMSISVYWSHMFLYSRAILKRLNTIRRSFMWFGNFEDSRPEPRSFV